MPTGGHRCRPERARESCDGVRVHQFDAPNPGANHRCASRAHCRAARGLPSSAAVWTCPHHCAPRCRCDRRRQHRARPHLIPVPCQSLWLLVQDSPNCAQPRAQGRRCSSRTNRRITVRGYGRNCSQNSPEGNTSGSSPSAGGGGRVTSMVGA